MQMSADSQTEWIVKVIHGTNDGLFDVAGHTVGVVRFSLEGVFNMPPNVAAFINGEPVESSYVLFPNDTLEFMTQQGQKGLGDLLSPEDMMARWRLTIEQYQELRDRGLPAITFADGTVRHPEVLVDEWWKVFDGHSQPIVSLSVNTRGWLNPSGSEPPPSHQFGPLEGTQKQLASWVHPHGSDDPRHLQTRAEAGGIWVRKIHARLYEVWFRSQQAFEAAQRRQREGVKPPQTA
jgi:hypothetical protein